MAMSLVWRFANLDAMDLSVEYPRSPRERLAGLDLLARTIDLARAQLAGTLGDYTYWSCPFNRILFDAELAAAPGAQFFLDSVRESLEKDCFVSDQYIRSGEARQSIDNFVADWINRTVKPSSERIAEMNAHFEQLAPNRAEQ